jgi:ATP diphosphatase
MTDHLPIADSLLRDVDPGPPLTRAIALGRAASAGGFDWPSALDVLPTVREELDELFEAVRDAGPAETLHELGDLLFAACNLARHLELDPEVALAAANARFVARFARVEAAVSAQGRPMRSFTIEELDALWDQAKLSLSGSEEGPCSRS